MVQLVRFLSEGLSVGIPEDLWLARDVLTGAEKEIDTLDEEPLSEMEILAWVAK